MNLTLDVTSVTEVKAMLDGMGKNSKKATQRWVNWIGIGAQAEMRKALPTRFHMRGTTEGFERAVVFTAAQRRGTRDRAAELHIGGPGFGQSRTQKLGVLLARHEADNQRSNDGQVYFDGRGRAMTGLGFFLPAKGLRTNTQNPPRKLYPANIGAALRLSPDSRLYLAKGTKNKKGAQFATSYFATRKGIFRRVHSLFGRSTPELVWFFKRTVKTPARLGLWDTARQYSADHAHRLGIQAIDETVFAATLGK